MTPARDLENWSMKPNTCDLHRVRVCSFTHVKHMWDTVNDHMLVSGPILVFLCIMSSLQWENFGEKNVYMYLYWISRDNYMISFLKDAEHMYES